MGRLTSGSEDWLKLTAELKLLKLSANLRLIFGRPCLYMQSKELIGAIGKLRSSVTFCPAVAVTESSGTCGDRPA